MSYWQLQISKDPSRYGLYQSYINKIYSCDGANEQFIPTSGYMSIDMAKKQLQVQQAAIDNLFNVLSKLVKEVN